MADKVFLITGASTGIGAATARAAAQAGYARPRRALAGQARRARAGVRRRRTARSPSSPT